MSSAAARLDELCAEHGVDAEGRRALATFLELLASDPSAPTTVRAPAEAVETHVADALAGLAVPELRGARRIADVGAGAGVPALVLAVALPEARVVAVESAVRKCAFLERAVGAMGLPNVEVVHARAEEWREGFGGSDVVTARAVAPLPVLVEYAAPLLAPEGALVAWKGHPEPDEQRDGDAAAEILGLSPARRVVLPPRIGAERRMLYVYLKVRSLPNGYPRRPGMARKRPLRASG